MKVKMKDMKVKELKKQLEKCNDEDFVILDIDIDYDFGIGRIKAGYLLDVEYFTNYYGRDGNYAILSGKIRNDSFKGVL